MNTNLFRIGAVVMVLAIAAGAWTYATSAPVGASVAAKATDGSCCYPGSPCCYPGSPCCEGNDCCFSGSPCCVPGAACCESTESAPTVRTCCSK